MSECNRTMEISPRWSLEITARTGGIPHSSSSSSSGMLIFQLSFLDLSCSGSHQPTCAGAARPGLNKLEPPPPANALHLNITICPPSLCRELQKGGSPSLPHAATASSRPSSPSIVRLTVSLTPTFYPLL